MVLLPVLAGLGPLLRRRRLLGQRRLVVVVVRVEELLERLPADLARHVARVRAAVVLEVGELVPVVRADGVVDELRRDLVVRLDLRGVDASTRLRRARARRFRRGFVCSPWSARRENSARPM